MHPSIRKTVTWTEEQLAAECGPSDPPIHLLAAATVVTNPWADGNAWPDVESTINAYAPDLGALLTDTILDLAGASDVLDHYGKAVMVGSAGEIAHASALAEALRFASPCRKRSDTAAALPVGSARGEPAAPVKIPLSDAHTPRQRSQELAIRFSISDAPARDEIVVAMGAAIGARPHRRSGLDERNLAALFANRG